MQNTNTIAPPLLCFLLHACFLLLLLLFFITPSFFSFKQFNFQGPCWFNFEFSLEHTKVGLIRDKHMWLLRSNPPLTQLERPLSLTRVNLFNSSILSVNLASRVNLNIINQIHFLYCISLLLISSRLPSLKELNHPKPT
jgi:hypothetical protein